MSTMEKVTVAVFYKDREGVIYPYTVEKYSRVPVAEEIIHLGETDNHYIVKKVIHCSNEMWDAEVYCTELGDNFSNVDVWQMVE